MDTPAPTTPAPAPAAAPPSSLPQGALTDLVMTPAQQARAEIEMLKADPEWTAPHS
jgi:hypothetical protein